MRTNRLTRSADPHPKILDLHRKKLAVIYVRQSSLYQVENHLERCTESLSQRTGQLPKQWHKIRLNLCEQRSRESETSISID